MTIKVAVLLCAFILVSSIYASDGQLVILLEASNTSVSMIREASSSLFNESTPLHIHLQQLGGRRSCSRDSTGGGVLQSGIQYFTLNLNTEKSFRAESLHLAIVSTECIRECIILKSCFSHVKFAVPVLSVIPSVWPAAPGEFYMTPPAVVLVQAFFLLCQSLEWTRVALVTDNSDLFMARTSEYLLHSAKGRNVTISPYVESTKLILRTVITTQHILKTIKDSGTRITVLSVNMSHTADILCAAYNHGMVWPHYGWVVHTLPRSGVIRRMAHCKNKYLLEGVIFLTYDLHFSPGETNIPKQAEVDSTEFFIAPQLANLSLDAVGLLTEASVMARKLQVDVVTALMRTTYTGVTGTITFDEARHAVRDILFIQVKNHSDVVQAVVKNGSLVLNRWLHEGELPNGDLPVRVVTIFPVWLGALEIIVCTLLITTVLVLYLYYRKEPEIRATSVPLSLLMLLGCYMIVIYLITLTLLRSFPSPPHFNYCIFINWMSAIGLSYPLILAALLVKMLRVYHIFHYYGKLGKASSDLAMVLFVLVILSPIILVLMVMTVINEIKLSPKYTVRHGYTEVKYLCSGDLGIYSISLAIYIILLALCSAVVAVKTRKLRIKHFRDAKKVNAFLFLYVLIGISALILYQLFTTLSLQLQVHIVLYVTHGLLVLFCLGFLFVPKLSPLLYNKYFKK